MEAISRTQLSRWAVLAPNLAGVLGEEQVLACPSVLCRAGQRSECCPGRLRDRPGSSVHDSLACGVVCASANGARSRTAVQHLLRLSCSAHCGPCQEGSNGSIGSIFAWWHFKYRNGAPFSGDKKPFSYGCGALLSVDLRGFRGQPGLACPEPLCCSRRRETEARRVWGSITESSLEGFVFHYPWDLGCDKVSGTSCF